MRHEELKELGHRLGQLAEAFDRKPPTPGAMLVWFDVLREFSLAEIESMLVDMPKRLTKFPAPADVWKACNERRSDRIENNARMHAKEIVIRIASIPVNTALAKREMANIKQILDRPRPSKRAWIDKIFQRHEDGDPTLCAYAVRLAREATEKPDRP